MHETMPQDSVDAMSLQIAHQLLMSDPKSDRTISGPSIERHLSSTAVFAAHLAAEYRQARGMPKAERDRVITALLSR
jgi:hypothetical protein